MNDAHFATCFGNAKGRKSCYRPIAGNGGHRIRNCCRVSKNYVAVENCLALVIDSLRVDENQVAARSHPPIHGDVGVEIRSLVLGNYPFVIDCHRVVDVHLVVDSHLVARNHVVAEGRSLVVRSYHVVVGASHLLESRRPRVLAYGNKYHSCCWERKR